MPALYRAASLQLEIFCVFYVVHRECTLQNWKYFRGKCLCWQFTRKKCFIWHSVLSTSQFLWSKPSPVCAHHAPLSLLALTASCHHISRGEMARRVSWEPHHHPTPWETRVGLVGCWMGPGYNATIQQDINIDSCYGGTASSKATTARWMRVISGLWPSLKSRHRVWLLAQKPNLPKMSCTSPLFPFKSCLWLLDKDNSRAVGPQYSI